MENQKQNIERSWKDYLNKFFICLEMLGIWLIHGIVLVFRLLFRCIAFCVQFIVDILTKLSNKLYSISDNKAKEFKKDDPFEIELNY